MEKVAPAGMGTVAPAGMETVAPAGRETVGPGDHADSSASVCSPVLSRRMPSAFSTYFS